MSTIQEWIAQARKEAADPKNIMTPPMNAGFGDL